MRMERGRQHPARGMEDENVRREGRRQVPARGMEDENMRVEGGRKVPAQGMEDERGEGVHHLPAERMDDGSVRRVVRGLEEGEGEDISDRIRPVIPPPDPEAGRGPDIDGWAEIVRVGGWGAMLTEFRLMDEVPEQHKSVWVWAAAEVLRRLHLAKTEDETTLALMWWCFLAQALLRKPSRGKRSGKGLVAKRFNSLGQDKTGGS